MTVLTTRPNATDASSGLAATGAANRHAALSDDSDSSYVQGAIGDSATLGFAEPTIPAGGLVKSIALRARTAMVTSGGRIYFGILLDGDPLGEAASVMPTWSAATTTTPLTRSTDVTPTTLAVAVGLLFGGTNYLRLYELFLDTTYVAKPVVAVSAPTGTLTTTNTPTVEWADTLDTDGGAQTAYEVKVFSAAEYGAGGFDPSTSTPTYTSGIVTGSAVSHAVTTALANATYRAYVRVKQTVDGAAHWSDWDYEGFTISVTAPSAPAITATLDAANGRTQIDLDDAGATSTDVFELQRTLDAGTTWEPVRCLAPAYGSLPTPTGDGGYIIPDSGLATVYDYEAPIGATAQYRARALHNYSGLYAAGAWATSSTVTSTSRKWWLKDPASPALNLEISIYSLPGHTRKARKGVFQPLGATSAIVVSDTRGPREGTIVVWAASTAIRDALDALLDTGRVLFLDGPAADQWPGRYVSIGDHGTERAADKAFVADTHEALPWTEVDAPADAVTGWPS